MGTQETETIYCDVKKETDKAYLVDAYIGKEVWLPKSQLENCEEVEHHLQTKGREGLEMEYPEWLLKEKELI